MSEPDPEAVVRMLMVAVLFCALWLGTQFVRGCT